VKKNSLEVLGSFEYGMIGNSDYIKRYPYPDEYEAALADLRELLEAARQLQADSLPFADGQNSETLGESRGRVLIALRKFA
jgi:hypothetical protein